jgi:hypothetical protein
VPRGLRPSRQEVSAVFKLYVKGFASRKYPDDGIDYEFCQDSTNAFGWATKGEAEIDGVHMDCSDVTIHSSEGTRHRCSGFQIERRATHQFVIFYEVPFLPANVTLLNDEEATAS